MNEGRWGKTGAEDQASEIGSGERHPKASATISAPRALETQMAEALSHGGAVAEAERPRQAPRRSRPRAPQKGPTPVGKSMPTITGRDRPFTPADGPRRAHLPEPASDRVLFTGRVRS